MSFLGYGPSGRPRFSFIAEDITERKRNEELLRQSNEDLRLANADLEQFAYSASHDLQEPLRQVAIYSQLIEKKYASNLDGKASTYLAYCVEGAHRMELLVSDLLAYCQAAKKSDSPLESVSIDEVIDTVKKNLATTIDESGAEILMSGLPVVRGNTVPLVHLFQNLVSNALKYRSDRKPVVRINAAEAAGSLVLFSRGQRDWNCKRVSNADFWYFQAPSRPNGISRHGDRSGDLPEDSRTTGGADLGRIRAGPRLYIFLYPTAFNK